ncbi:arsenate reductase [Pseudidiomarina tainanensis]|jgi:Spx/MgsR family transcriptional regulator|uniref:Transcriptional regulator, Spx/MgsR family n=2 Tax=Pseudidiomarina TaxID=2800384 RepID=A0A1I6G8J7_9GAMM|nr:MULTISPECIES: arsenate reductase [Pseudidiomarina]RZQ57035.1 arsenate reductase [Pseudidiomarina tainanensis]SFR38522.1 transcriptional regulator, Spx/MgsR family [Pseudidiomarina maritima]
MSIKVYGIPNCDTVRKARKWLEQQSVPFDFHDVRAEPVQPTIIQAWLEQLGVEKVINKRSTAWRELSAAQQHIASNADAIKLLQQHPTLMKRPLLDCHGTLCAGFNDKQWQAALEQA